MYFFSKGTGKTLLARAVASQLDCNFLKVSTEWHPNKNILEGNSPLTPGPVVLWCSLGERSNDLQQKNNFIYIEAKVPLSFYLGHTV